MSITRGSIVDGKVKSITKFGAFVELPTGQVGLVHVSEIANEYVEDISKFLKEDQVVRVKVMDIKEDGKRISLSIKKALEREDNLKGRNFGDKRQKSSDFESKLMRFLKESDEKLNEFKKRYDGKRR